MCDFYNEWIGIDRLIGVGPAVTLAQQSVAVSGERMPRDVTVPPQFIKVSC